MTGGLHANQPMMSSFTMPMPTWGGSQTQKVTPCYPWPSTSAWHVRHKEGGEASMKLDSPSVNESSPDLRSSSCGAGTRTRAMFCRSSSQQKLPSVSTSPDLRGSSHVGTSISTPTTHRCNMASGFEEQVPTTYGHKNVNEIKEPVPTTYGVRANSPSTVWTSPILGKSAVRTCTKPFISGLSGRVAATREASQTAYQYNMGKESNKNAPVTHSGYRATYGINEAGKSQARVQTTCESDEAREFTEPVPKTFGSNKTNECTEAMPKVRTNSHANYLKEPVPNEVAETVANLGTCSSANDFKELVPTTYGSNKTNEFTEAVPRPHTCSNANDLKGPVPTTYGSNKTNEPSKAKHDDGEAASVTNKTLLVESSPVHHSEKCRAPTHQTRRPGSQAGSPSRKSSVGLGGGSPSRILTSGRGGSILMRIASPALSTNQVVFKEPVPTTYGYNTAKEFKEPVPTTYGHNMSVESELKAPVPTTYGYNMAKEPKEPVPMTYGRNKSVESAVKAAVPTTYGYNKASELRSGAKVRLAGLKAIKYNGKRGDIVRFDRSGLCHVRLEDGEGVSTKAEHLVVETINHGHPNSALMSCTTNSDVSDAAHAIWQQSTAALCARQHGSLTAKFPGQVAMKSSFFDASLVGQLSPVKLVVFDFDCTLSVFHVFASLGGGPATPKLPVPAPHARTERGQLQRLTELDAHPDWGPGIFALRAFGGNERVAQLRKALEALVWKGVDCIVCSRGFVGTIRRCLDQLNLLSLFSHTLGSLGNRFGTSSYDEAAARSAGAEHYLGSTDMDVGQAGAVSKAETVTTWITARGLKDSEVIYIDDDITELTNSSVHTIHVAGGSGIGDAELQLLRVMVDAGGPCGNDTASVGTPSTSASISSGWYSED